MQKLAFHGIDLNPEYLNMLNVFEKINLLNPVAENVFPLRFQKTAAHGRTDREEYKSMTYFKDFITQRSNLEQNRLGIFEIVLQFIVTKGSNVRAPLKRNRDERCTACALARKILINKTLLAQISFVVLSCTSQPLFSPLFICESLSLKTCFSSTLCQNLFKLMNVNQICCFA